MSFFQRTKMLLGNDAIQTLASKRVIIFGVGGVGSWCAESLVRTGIGHLTIVDFDSVSQSNVNRQLMATAQTVGQPKVEVLRQRLQSINPEAEINALQQVFNESTAEHFDIGSYDYVIDAIDSLKDKALLIRMATATDAVLFSSMGAARKIDPSRIKVVEFWKVKGDPLARALRKYFKRSGLYPHRKFMCVFSDELSENKPVDNLLEKANGTIVHITAIFGFTLASLVVRDIVRV